MELRTYTRIWSVEKRLYKLYDVNLPYPVSLKQVGIFFGVAIPWFVLCTVLGIPFSPPVGYLIWLAPPIALAWVGNKPVAEGKSLVDFTKSQVKFFFSERQYTDMMPAEKESTFNVEGYTWERTKGKKTFGEEKLGEDSSPGVQETRKKNGNKRGKETHAKKSSGFLSSKGKKSKPSKVDVSKNVDVSGESSRRKSLFSSKR